MDVRKIQTSIRKHTRNKKSPVLQYGNRRDIFKSFIWSKLNYIHVNPVRKRIVEKASHYIYSNATNYVNDGTNTNRKATNPVVDVLNLTHLQSIINNIRIKSET
jgi:hypothetical protein